MGERNHSDASRYLMLGFAGAAVGLIIAITTRPSFLGIKVPLSILGSSHPVDAVVRSELLSNIAMYTVSGAAIGCMLAFILVSMVPAASGPQPQGAYDSKKWKAMVEVDPDIAEQVRRISPFGQVYVDELAHKYLAIDDKNYLIKIADTIVGRAQGDLASQKAARMSNAHEFMGYRYRWDQEEQFWGEVKPGSDDFRAFQSEAEFRVAVSDYLARGKPPIEARAIVKGAVESV